MPSTYSTNLKIELIATGEQSGTWGTTTDTNLGTLIEEAICGVGTVAMADADTTISIANGASSTARKVVLTITGVLTAARNLTVPSINKTYIVYNNTTGGFAVTVKTSAGTGISVPNGQKRMVYGDSTNINEAINSVGDLNVNGNSSVTGNATVTGTMAAGTVTIGGKSISVNNNTTLTTTADSNVTLPTTGTLATLAGSETFTNKTLTSPTINGGSVTNATLTTSSVNAAPSAGDNTLLVACTSFVTQALAVLIPPGTTLPFAGTSAPSGWLLSYGQVLSQASYPNLYTAIGSQYNTGGEGAGNFRLPDLRGRIVAGADNMGGSAAGRLTVNTITPDGDTIGAVGGTQEVTLTASQQASMPVTGTSNSGTTSIVNTDAFGPLIGYPTSSPTPNPLWSAPTSLGTISGTATGGGQAHINVQPTIIMNYIIKI